MWPWEHAVVGYLAYSLLCHGYYRESPSGIETVVVVFASVLPDLIDKPLAWEYGVFDAGFAIGHSLFFAVPLAIVVGLVTRGLDHPRVGVAFGIGYLFHLPSDLLPVYVERGEVPLERILWPYRSVEAGHVHHGFREQVLFMIDTYRESLLTASLSTYEWAQLGVGVFVFCLWIVDGTPVLRELVLGGNRLLRTWASRASR